MKLKLFRSSIHNTEASTLKQSSSRFFAFPKACRGYAGLAVAEILAKFFDRMSAKRCSISLQFGLYNTDLLAMIRKMGHTNEA